MSAQAFRKHVKEKHTDSKIFSCKWCKKDFGSNGNLQQHWEECPQTQGGWQSIVLLKTVRRAHITLTKKHTRTQKICTWFPEVYCWIINCFFNNVICMYD